MLTNHVHSQQQIVLLWGPGLPWWCKQMSSWCVWMSDKVLVYCHHHWSVWEQQESWGQYYDNCPCHKCKQVLTLTLNTQWIHFPSLCYDIRHWIKNPISRPHCEWLEQHLTCLFNLRLPRLGGGYELSCGLRDTSGRLLQALQISTVLVRFDLHVKQQQTDQIILP